MTVTYLNDYSGIIIQFYLSLIFDLSPRWNTNVAFGSTTSYLDQNWIVDWPIFWEDYLNIAHFQPKCAYFAPLHLPKNLAKNESVSMMDVKY